MTGLPLASVEMYLRGQDPGYQQGLLIIRGLPDQETINYGLDRMVILSRGAGLPLMGGEWEFDPVIVTLRSVGVQGDYDDAEALADLGDTLMLAPSNVTVGASSALYVRRVGGGPVPVMRDSSKRMHFQCSYVIPVVSGLK